MEKSPFTKLGQIGVIVSDMDKAVAHYESLGIGPFKVLEKPAPVERTAFGKLANDLKLKIMVAYMGDVEFELIQPVSEGSVQMKSLKTHGEGISHLGFYVEDVNKEVDEMVAKGYDVICSVKRVDGSGSAYFDTDRVGGVQFEVIQVRPSKEQA
ncbi:MAG: VOC family protein [bacterium]